MTRRQYHPDLEPESEDNVLQCCCQGQCPVGVCQVSHLHEPVIISSASLVTFLLLLWIIFSGTHLLTICFSETTFQMCQNLEVLIWNDSNQNWYLSLKPNWKSEKDVGPTLVSVNGETFLMSLKSESLMYSGFVENMIKICYKMLRMMRSRICLCG